MALQPAAKFIPEFGFEGLTEPLPPAPEKSVAPGSGNLQFLSLAARAASRAEDAYQTGYAAGRRDAQADLDARLEEQRAYYADQLALERYAWANREAEQLAKRVDDGLKEIEARIAQIVSGLLRPVLSEGLQRKAVADLSEALEALLGANEGITLEIEGPDDLLQLLREKLGHRNIAAALTPSDGVDVRVVAGQTVLETCLGTWLKRVEESVA